MDNKPLVLLIDDEPDLVEMMAYQFRARNYLVETASNGLEGLERLKTITPQLIVLDLNMPKMGGFEFYQRICGADGKPAYPVLVLTARANTEQMFRDFDIDGFMAKPFEIEDLIKEADAIMKKHARPTAAVKEAKKGLYTVYIADNDEEALYAASTAFLKEGYRVAAFKTATSALEGLFAAPPEFALIKLGLPDIAGDIAAQRAGRMAKTSHVKFILFEPRDSRHHKAVRDGLANKTGIFELIEYEKPSELVDAIEQALRGMKVEGVMEE
jgi:DNA-binding response OmpR family regulator